MQGVFFKIKEKATNPNLPEIGVLEIPFIYAAEGFSRTQIWVRDGHTAPVVLSVTTGTIFADEAGQNSLGNSVSWNTPGQKEVWIKATQAGSILIRNSVDVSRFGNIGDWNPANVFMTTNYLQINNFDIANLSQCIYCEAVKLQGARINGNISVFENMPLLKSVVLNEGGGAITGDMIVFKDKPITHINMGNSVPFDAAKLPTELVGIQTSSTRTPTLRYTGGANDINFRVGFSAWNTQGLVAYPTAELDMLLIALANGMKTATANRTLTFKGQRTSASDAAIATLSAKKYTVDLQ